MAEGNDIFGVRADQMVGSGMGNPVEMRSGKSNPVEMRSGKSNPVEMRSGKSNPVAMPSGEGSIREMFNTYRDKTKNSSMGRGLMDTLSNSQIDLSPLMRQKNDAIRTAMTTLNRHRRGMDTPIPREMGDQMNYPRMTEMPKIEHGVNGKPSSYIYGDTRVMMPSDMDLSDNASVDSYMRDTNDVIDWMNTNDNNEEEDF